MKIRNLIEKSIYKHGRPSSSRIFSYVMMLVIFMLGIVHAGTEIGNAIISWTNDEPHVPSINSISITAMWLAHQLTLLGIYKRSEIDVKEGKINQKSEQLNS